MEFYWRLLLFAVILIPSISGKPTVYMKNENDKLEPVLMPVSSTVIPIPVYQVSANLGVRSGKSDAKKKYRLLKPDGPTKLITVSGLKKLMAHEQLKSH